MARRAFTLLELLITISIISVLIAIFMPGLGGAREAANVTMCLTNLSTLTKTAGMYMDDEGKLTQPWYLPIDGYSPRPSYISEFVFGGFNHEREHPRYPRCDTIIIPSNARPYNKYISPGALGRSPIKAYVCPSDKSYDTPLVHQDVPLDGESALSSWMVNGNSYAINWYWQNAPPWEGRSYTPLASMSAAGMQLLQPKVGGEASRFVLFMENAMNAFMDAARPSHGAYGESRFQQLAVGWHRRLSQYASGFLDGHARYGFVDTRFTDGPEHDIWPSRQTRGPNWP